MFDALEIIDYPDPRLRKISREVVVFDERLEALVKRMFELMREAKGVGLAAPQVGENVRLFIISPTGKPEDDRVYVNPQLSDADGAEDGEEGCLSLPGLHVDVTRATVARMNAQDLTGKPFEQLGEDYVARIWQHELDHLNGVLLLDRMGPVARMENKKLIKELEDAWIQAHGPIDPKARG